MKKNRIGLLVVVTLVSGCFLFWQSVIYVAGQQAQELVAVTVSSHQRWMRGMAELTLRHLTNLPEVKKLTPESCEQLQEDLINGDKLIAVLAIGDKDGNPICSADPSIPKPLPTMADREYFTKVKTADGLVVGNYEISKTMNKPVLHYAYPIRGEKGEFRGFVMMAMDLAWFPDELVDHVFSGKNTQIMAVDRNGRILFVSPSTGAQVGERVVGKQLLRQLLKDDISHKLMVGPDGEYRVYAQAPMGDMTEGVMVFAGVSLFDYQVIMWMHGAFIVVVSLWLWVRYKRE